MKNPIVIYHSNCSDGFAAMWCFWRYFKDNADYYPGRYQETPPDVKDRDVYLVDFSYKRNVVLEMSKSARSITLIDHHASALNDLVGLSSIIDMSYSSNDNAGCVLAWNYVQKNFWKGSRTVPQMLLHIEDRDLWKFKLEDTRAVGAYLFSLEMNLEVFTEAVTNFTECLERGKVLDAQHLKAANIILKQCSRYIELEGSRVLLVNTPMMFTSDIGNIAAKAEAIVFMYSDTANYREFSLRSSAENPNAVDVSKVAEYFGGGGHKHAAGFKVSRDHYLAKL